MTPFTNEDQLLNEDFRKEVIDEIVNSPENLERKANELRKHEIYRDQNSKWVMRGIEQEGFKKETVEQMRNRATNISICRRIVNKLSQTYTGGVDRVAEDEASQASMDSLCDELDLDTKLKKADRYRQLFRNTLLQVVPIPNRVETERLGTTPGATPVVLHDLVIKNLAAWEYDVIEDPFDRTKAAVVILTDFPERAQFYAMNDAAGSQGYRLPSNGGPREGDGRDQTIADSASDVGSEKSKRTFIFWSDKYHFTTNYLGKILRAPDGNLNPIRRLPFVNIHSDQDGQFWAKGGEDVVEGSLLINKKLTDINFISFVQGWGQLVVAARNVPKKLIGGPDNAFVFDLQPDDPVPSVFYASSNPPIDQWLETVRTLLALLLSTNDLSVKNISAKLEVSNVASGVALMIDGSEDIQDIKDLQKLYQDKEPELWELLRLWHTMYSERGALTPRFEKVPTYENSNVILKFHTVKPPMSEKDHLDNLKLRKDLGLNTVIDLLKRDNPDLTDDQAQEKYAELVKDKEAMKALLATQLKDMQATDGLKPKPNPDQVQQQETYHVPTSNG